MNHLLRTYAVIFSSALLLAISACSTDFDPFDPPAGKPTAAPTDWITPGYSVNHTKVEAVAPDKIPLVKLALSESQTANLVKPLADGGCLAVCQIPVDENDPNGNPNSYMKATRFKSNGSILWEKQYDAFPFQGSVSSLCVFPDGGFAVSVQVLAGTAPGYSLVDRLYRFSPDGDRLWTSDDTQVSAGALQFIFAGSDGAVLTAGTVTLTKPDGSYDNNDIRLLRFEKDGNLSKKSTAGTPLNDTMMNAAYAEGTGLIFTWRSDGKEEIVVDGVSYNQVSKVDCHDENLDEKWTTAVPMNQYLFDVTILPDDNGCIVSGWLLGSQKKSESGVPQYTLTRFAADGSIKWTFRDEEDTGMRLVAKLSDGRFVGGWFMNVRENGEKSQLVVLSDDGTVLDTMEPLTGIISGIVPTGDGGFTVILVQSVRSLPQPPYISSIWVDTEAVVAHYDKNLKLVWRRSIDQYKHSRRSDIVVPTVDDRLLVG